MVEEKEIEFKTLLTKQQYLYFLNYFSSKNHQIFWQYNYYYDTINSWFSNRKATLRVRVYEEDMKPAVWTVKYALTDTISQEFHYEMTELEVQSILKKDRVCLPKALVTWLKQWDPSFEEASVICMGQLATKRCHVFCESMDIMLDLNEYVGIRDYELEIEVNDIVQGKKDVALFYEQHNLEYIPAESKIKRMIHAQIQKY